MDRQYRMIRFEVGGSRFKMGGGKLSECAVSIPADPGYNLNMYANAIYYRPDIITDAQAKQLLVEYNLGRYSKELKVLQELVDFLSEQREEDMPVGDYYNSREATLDHIEVVKEYLSIIVCQLGIRASRHDASKLGPWEKPIFDEYTPKLKNCTYGSDEYKQFLSEMSVALDHHYAHNRHHPEYFLLHPDYKDTPVENSPLERMNLVDLVEMFCDWMAATKRHADGDIYESIEYNQSRFGYSDELKQIFHNTAGVFEQKSDEPELL